MQQPHPPLVQIILRYDAPLQRYARRLVKDQAVAAAIVKEVFERVYELNKFNINDKTLRSLFKGTVLKMASAWLLHGEGRPQTTDDGRKEGPWSIVDRNKSPWSIVHSRTKESRLETTEQKRCKKSAWSIVRIKNSQPLYLHHKNYYLLSRLNSRALSLLKTQFAKKPKNPT